MGDIILTSAKDSGNRGCEAIARGTACILHRNKYRNVIAYSENYDLDYTLGLQDLLELRKLPNVLDSEFLDKCYYHMKHIMIKNKRLKIEHAYGREYEGMIHRIDKKDIALSTGGDMLCYGDNELFYINKSLHKRGVKTVFWGCSVGKENLTPEKIKLLHVFDAIITRETLTYGLMKKLNLKNVFCFPDPAFSLEAMECKLPNYLSCGDVVGINLSNFVGKDVGIDTIVGKNIASMIDFIINNTDFNIMLIPHVFWSDQDDSVICHLFYDIYKKTGRIHVLQSELLNYCQIRYAISKCRFFIGARTHAMISAYSTAIPALALGYSVKSRGIAHDLGLPEELVININDLNDNESFTNSFKYLMDNESNIKKIYNSNLSEYKRKTFDAEKIISAMEN